MKKSFINLLRQPDSVLFQFDDSGVRFEEPDGREEQNARLDYVVGENSAKVVIYPAEKGIKRVKLRWRGDMSDVILTVGDEYERSQWTNTLWTGLYPNKQMPWYFYAFDGEVLNSFGVKTGPSAFAIWQCDSSGITLWLDVRSGGSGVMLKEPLTAVEVVCREGKVGETPYQSAVAFCKMMCEKPKLPQEPVFGVNNWYWAYGNITHDSVMEETKYLKEMCADAVCNPYMVIDDGWQKVRYSAGGSRYFNGGPWDEVAKGFTSMEETALRIKEQGAKPGIWFRPLKTALQVPQEAFSKSDSKSAGISLDPTHPCVAEMVATDVKRIRSWGYELIKHDFTTMDVLTKMPMADANWKLYDNSITSCQALRCLYQLIQDSADGAIVIGCNTMNHLAAGIHEVQRSGDDTSGNVFEITRHSGVHTFVRMPQNKTFFIHDPDCAAFTDRVPHDINLDFLEASAISGAATLASVVPNTLTNEEMARIRKIYKIASEGGAGAVPTDWLGNNEPSKFLCADGKQVAFDWYRVYDGVRNFYKWDN